MNLQKLYGITYLIILPLLLACNGDDPTNPSTNLPGSLRTINTFGGSANDSGQSVIATIDGGYAVLGFTQSNDGDVIGKTDTSFDYWLLKFNNDGILQWQKIYGGSGDDRGSAIIQTSDGGYAVIGSSNSLDGQVSGNSGFRDYWLAKLDANGNIQFQNSFGFQGNDDGISLIQTKDQGYLLAGVLDVTASGGEGNTGRNFQRHAGGDYWTIKLDSAGNLEWSRYFGGNFTDTPEGIIELEDGSYIIAGGSDSDDTDISENLGSYDFWIIRISETGALIWEQSFGGSEIDEAKAIVADAENIFIVGDTRSSDNDVTMNKGASDIWLIKINVQGELLWNRNFGGLGFDAARDIKLCKDNGLLITGSSRSSDGDLIENKGQNDLWALKVDSDGRLQWQKSIGGSNIDFGYSIAELNDGTVVVAGDTSSNDGDIEEQKGFSDLLLVILNN